MCKNLKKQYLDDVYNDGKSQYFFLFLKGHKFDCIVSSMLNYDYEQVSLSDFKKHWTAVWVCQLNLKLN